MTERSVFVAALDFADPAARAAYLDRACGADATLRQRVEHLLATFERAGNFLEAPASGLNANSTLDQPPITERSGAFAGPYKLMEQLGEGGFGLVFVAEQQHPVRRRVALKVIKPGMHSAQVIARFEAERQALAMMNHQNIAKVLDAGTTDSGRPYFVMELVHGVPITEYCDASHLTPRQRLELFVSVCHAVQHAHQKGVIHRDLKPSNVLVTMYDDKPVPKIIDFGVAKAIEQRLTEKTVYTHFGTLVGTFEYMSPEQAEMNAFGVDTRSDIYSLGVLLYELLTGTTPLERARLRQAAFDEIRRIIKEEEAQRPSIRLSTSETRVKVAAARQTDPAKLSKLMRGELDWVVMKCLEKDRSRRYETANGLARDVERYLRDESVEARPPSPWYRFGKLARRNKRALATASIMGVMLMVAVGAVAGSVGWLVRDQEARRTRVAGQLDLILGEVYQLQKEQKWPEALTATRRAEALLKGGDGDEQLHERVRQVVSDLELVQKLETIRLERRDHAEEGSLTWADRAYSAAFREAGLDLDAIGADEAVERLKPRAAVATALAWSLDEWALSRVYTKNTAGARPISTVADRLDADPWRRQLRAAVSQFDIDRLVLSKTGARTLPETEAANALVALQRLIASPDFDGQPPFALFYLGMVLCDWLEKPDLAITVLRRAHTQYPGDFWINAGLAECLSRLGPERQHDAIAFFQATVALRPNVAWGWARIGNIRQFGQKRMDEANAAYRKALALESKNAWVHNLVGWGLAAQKKLDEAARHYRRAIELDETFAVARTNLGAVLRDQKKYDDSIAAILRAVEFDPKRAETRLQLGLTLLEKHKASPDDKILGESVAAMAKAVELAPAVAGYQWGLGWTLNRQKKLDNAVACFRRGIDLDPKHGDCHWGLGATLLDQKKPEQAFAALREAVALQPEHSYARELLAHALLELGKTDEAITSFRQAVALDPKNMGHRYHLGRALQQSRRTDEAITAFHEALAIYPKDLGTLYHLGRALRELRRTDEAIDTFGKALAINPKDKGTRWQLADALRELRRTDEAMDIFREAIAIDSKDTDARYNLALLLAQQGKTKEAVTGYGEVVRLNPNDVRALVHFGNFLQLNGQVDEALECFRKAVQMDAKFAGADGYLALHLAAASDPNLRYVTAALVHARMAVALAPTQPGYRLCLGVALLRTGDPKGALEALDKIDTVAADPFPYHRFLLAMAYWQNGEKEKARRAYEQGVQWMDETRSNDPLQRRFQAEAAEMLNQKD